MEDSRNMFALFEHKNAIDRAVESRVIVADVLAKFERSDYSYTLRSETLRHHLVIKAVMF